MSAYDPKRTWHRHLGVTDGAILDPKMAAARKIGLEVAALDIRRAEDIASAFATLKGWADALYVVHEPLVSTCMAQINSLALGAHLPTMQDVREDVEAGGLVSYGPNFSD
jgi:putative tryptophan/tyrosine transport system substrate-binding protein